MPLASSIVLRMRDTNALTSSGEYLPKSNFCAFLRKDFAPSLFSSLRIFSIFQNAHFTNNFHEIGAFVFYILSLRDILGNLEECISTIALRELHIQSLVSFVPKS